MDLTQMSQAEWMCDGKALVRDPSYDDAFSYSGASFTPYLGAMIWDLGDGYAIHASLNDPTDALATKNGALIGYYIGEGLALDKGHFRKRVGVAMVLAASLLRPPPERRKVTQKGEEALRRAWRFANGTEQPPWTIPAWIPHFPYVSPDEDSED